eukprot:scaffold1123_cov253-Pinguiococcus_pyrenoidosus.AAC.11
MGSVSVDAGIWPRSECGRRTGEERLPRVLSSTLEYSETVLLLISCAFQLFNKPSRYSAVVLNRGSTA